MARIAQPPTLDVRDDGHGLLWGDVGMHERARRAGGTLEIKSDPGQGTVLSLRIPTDVHGMRD